APAQFVLLLRGEHAGTLGERGLVSDAHALRVLQVACVLGDDERRDAVRLRGGEIGTGGDHEDLPYPGMRDEDLGPVQDVVVAPVDRRGLGAAGVRAGARLRPGESAFEIVPPGARPDDLLREVAHQVAHLVVLLGEVEGRVHGGEYSRTLTSHIARYMSHAAPFRAACNV